MEYKIDDKMLKAPEFIKFVNKVWPGKYDISKSQDALSKTMNITAYDGDRLVGCLRILSDGYFFGTITELLVLPDYYFYDTLYSNISWHNPFSVIHNVLSIKIALSRK